MATAAQCLANHANAQLSTGPRTGQGKARSAQNHLSHGLSSREFIVLPGQQAEFEEFSAGLREAVQPVGALEFDLFTQLAHASWKLRRCRCAASRASSENRRMDALRSNSHSFTKSSVQAASSHGTVPSSPMTLPPDETNPRTKLVA